MIIKVTVIVDIFFPTNPGGVFFLFFLCSSHHCLISVDFHGYREGMSLKFPFYFNSLRGLLVELGGSDGKESACNAGDQGLIPGSGRSPGEENDNPLFVPGESHAQRSLLGCSPWGRNESDMTEQLT